MSVYRRKYSFKRRDGTDVRGRSKFFTVELKSPDGSLVRKKTGLTDRKAAQTFESDLRRQLERGSVGMIDGQRDQKKLKIESIVDRFVEFLASNLKRDDMYCYTMEKRLKRLAREAGWSLLGQVTLKSFEEWRSDGSKWREKSLKPKTTNQYLDALRRFIGWCKKQGLVETNFMLDAEKAVAVPNPSYRRAATPEEFQRLLASVDPERRQFYLFVLYCPLRRDTLRTLQCGDLRLDGDAPFVVIRGEAVKSRRQEKSALRPDIAEMMREAIKGKKTDDPVFDSIPSIDDLKEDLAKAGVRFDDGHGSRRLDLHAFRKTLIRWMKRAGVPLEQASLALHHKDLNTTRKHYDDDQVDAPLTDAVKRLPGMLKANENGSRLAQGVG